MTLITTINKLFPHNTVRRVWLSAIAKFHKRPMGSVRRLGWSNWKIFSAYRSKTFLCNVCGEKGTPLYDFPDPVTRRRHGIGVLRETLQCRACGSTMRHRALAAALLRVLNERLGTTLDVITQIDQRCFENTKILDTDAFSPISLRLRGFSGYIISSYLPSVEFDTEMSPGYFNVNLEDMSFPGGAFDIVLTSDVMEHVRDVNSAHSEIARVLKEGGAYVFTVPYDQSINDHRTLVRTTDEGNEFLEPPHYHGDPITGGVLAYRIFGKNIISDLAKINLNAKFLSIYDEAALIVDGDVFIAYKQGRASSNNLGLTRNFDKA